MSAASLRAATKRFGDTTAVDAVTLDVKDGEFVVLLGPTGAGKTTTLRLFAGLEMPDEGTVTIAGEDVTRLGPAERDVAFVFQQYSLYPHLTVYENLEIPLSYRNVKRKERQAIVADSLDRFQIVGKKDLYPSQLSGGQQQLVAVARAIIAEPAMILADEPTGSLHSSQGRMILDLLKQLNREGTTIIQVTHNEEYAAFGDRIIQLRDGWIVDE